MPFLIIAQQYIVSCVCQASSVFKFVRTEGRSGLSRYESVLTSAGKPERGLAVDSAYCAGSLLLLAMFPISCHHSVLEGSSFSRLFLSTRGILHAY